MPYKPNQVGEYERSWSYDMMWIGLPAAIILIVGREFEALSFLTALAGGATAGTLIGLSLQWNADEFVRGQIAFAANFALSFAGVMMFMTVAPSLTDHAPSTATTLSWMALIFHLALAYRRLRDRV